MDVTPEGKAGRTKYGQCWVFAGVLSSLGRDGAGTTATTTIKSEAGSEDITLVESDAWLHGSAAVKALPKADAALTLTLYDKGSAALISFSGTLGADGEVTLTADETKEPDTVCASKTGCGGESSSTTLDVEVLAADMFAASGGYELGLDLVGADTYEVAYAAVTVTESTEVTTCDKVNGCTTAGSSTTTKAEVDWDEIGAVWEGELTLNHEGAVDVKVKSLDDAGEVIENTHVALGAPWLDGGEGINVLGVDGDPLTTVGLVRGPRSGTVFGSGGILDSPRVAITSSGWTSTTAPVAAELELDDGGTITMSSPTLLRARKRPELLYQAWDTAISDYVSDIIDNPIYQEDSGQINPLHGARIKITGGNMVFADQSVFSMTESPICVAGGCFMIVGDGNGRYELSISEYGSVAAELPDALKLTVAVTDEAGKEVFIESGTVEFEDDVTAVFANEVSFSADPVGLDLSGEVRLLGATDSKGNQKTLAKGAFSGSFSRDGDGDLGLAAAEANAVASAGNVVVAGEAVGFELTDTDKDGEVDGPPVTLVTPLFGSERARLIRVRGGHEIKEHMRKR